jgi:acyl dehydratase
VVDRQAIPRRIGLWFEDYQVGSTYETAGRTVTEADVMSFAGITGDFNELHTNAELMRDSPFGARIAHGALVLSIVTGLRQQSGLFDATIIAPVEIRSWRYLAPVYIGDTVRARGEVVELRETSKPDRGLMIERISVSNQREAIVQEGETVTLVKRRPPRAALSRRG